MANRRTPAESARLAHELRDSGYSRTQIARSMRCSKSTVHRYLSEPAPPRLHSVPPAPVGNQRGLVHGVHSERKLAPLRQRWALEVRERWPWLDDIRQAILADRLSRLEAARQWIDEQTSLVRGDGQPHALLKPVEQWATRVEVVVQGLEEERAARERGPLDLDAYLEANYSPEARARRAAEESNGDGS